jgi:hypothetical protein
MFDRLFKRPHVVVRHQKGPLAEERLRYLAFHAEQADTGRLFAPVLWTRLSSDYESTLVFDALTGLAISLDCTIFGTPLRSIA